MALITVRGYYRGGHIVLEELPQNVDEAEVLVTFIAPRQDGQSEEARKQAVQDMLELMERGFPLGGKGYQSREETYEERVRRFFESDG
ncbi:MAG: hypothetical protein NZ556_03320 [Fimbriimonadales bacterium]|nr:hypothetical protein [Fimbriimonadales bacterium]